MRFKLFSTSEKAWQAMFTALQQAQQSVLLEMYIFQDDTTQYDFVNLLCQKAQQGLKVKIVLDAFGSFSLTKKAVALLRQSGVEVLFFSYLLQRIHRKILVIDEKIAFIGGVNVHQSSQLWKDLAIRLEGKKIVHSITRSFAKVYRRSGGKDTDILHMAKRKKMLPKMRHLFVEHYPSDKTSKLKKAYQERLAKAQQHVILASPYFVPRRWLLGALHQAALRGVNIEILVPINSENFLMDRINYFYMRKASKLGIHFYIGPSMNHAKGLLIDGQEGMVGSQNLDLLSFEMNAEAGVFFSNVSAVQKLSEVLEQWKKESVPFDTAIHRAHWIDYLLAPFFNLFFMLT